jgi:hypothetical protein
MAFPIPKAVLDRLLPKDLKATKGDVAVVAAGGVLGLVVDIALLPLGIVTGGSAAAAGAATAFSAKTGVEHTLKKLKKRRQKWDARDRAERASKVFEEDGNDKGKHVLDKLLRLHDQQLMSALELDAAVDAQLTAYKKELAKNRAPKTPATPPPIPSRLQEQASRLQERASRRRNPKPITPQLDDAF